MMKIIMTAPQCEVAYVSVRNQAKRSSSQTSHKYTSTSMRSFKGHNGVMLKVNEEGNKGSRPMISPKGVQPCI